MNEQEAVSEALERIASSVDFVRNSAGLVQEWMRTANNLKTVEEILRFMERHSLVDFGMPGPLVHFVEQFHGRGYDERLIQSFLRKPTPQTAWMLNRLINGAETRGERHRLLNVLQSARGHPLADEETVRLIDEFVSHQSV